MIASLLLAASVVLAAPAEIQRSLDTFVSKAPGVVVVVGTVDHGTTHVYTAGTPPAGAPKLDEMAEFQIGSITKTFTATILGEMVLRKEVRLNDPISKYLPKGVHAPDYNGQPITLLNLAEQNSGLPRLPLNMNPADPNDPYADYTSANLYDFLNSYRLTRAPGAKYEYSNLGVGLLGQLLANRAKSSYADLVRTHVLAPLGMAHSSATLSPEIRSHLMPGFTLGLTPAAAWNNTDASAGAGAIDSTVADMLLYLKANMNAPQGPLGPAMALAHKPRTATSIPGQQIGLAWMTTPSGLVWHNGGTGGYSSFIGFKRDGTIGLVVLTNVAPDGKSDDLAIHLLEPDVVKEVLPIEAPAKPHGNSPFVGLYELAPTFKITIFEDDGVLYGQATGQPKFVLTKQSDLVYAIQGVDATITFVKDSAGKVTSLVLHQNGRDVPGNRVSP